jgi:hypothetical protein
MKAAPGSSSWRQDARLTMRANDSKSAGFGSVLLGMTALALACMVGTIGLLHQVAELGPKMGDIVTFDPLDPMSRDMKAQISASPVEQPGRTCLLDVRTMHAAGGSLIIEARMPRPQQGFRVHWAGGGSSEGASNCGGSADLVVDQQDIEILAMAVGGFGASARKLAHNSLWGSPSAVQ